MKVQYLHVSAFSCDKCRGPVISGSTAVRENEISNETDIREVGAICLSCGHRQSQATAPGVTRNFPPVQWDIPDATGAGHLATANSETLNRAEPH
jgi:hypothetical protein